MSTPSSQHVTQLLADWSNGDRQALDRLMPLVYDELRRLAHHHMRNEPRGHTLQTTADNTEELLALDEALTRLAQVDERASRVVELRHFGGLTNEEIAEVLQISPNTVMRDWTMARLWLSRELGSESKEDES